jgi:hypothetical protein
MIMESAQHTAARQALDRGLWIFPCAPGDKLPAWANIRHEFRIKWYEFATNDRVLVEQWWAFDPQFNIGVSCKKSGLLVVDCDIPKDGRPTTGVEQFHALCEKWKASWPQAVDTYQVLTPSGGRHFYYSWPWTEAASQRSLDVDLDVRTNGGDKGGYVVGAGSWSAEHHDRYWAVNEAPIRRCPEWLYRQVQAPVEQPSFTRADNFDRPYSPNLSGLHRELLGAREGNRNAMLNWCVFRAVSGNPNLTLDDVEREFADDARSIGLTESEIRATIRSAYSKAKR